MDTLKSMIAGNIDQGALYSVVTYHLPFIPRRGFSDPGAIYGIFTSTLLAPGLILGMKDRRSFAKDAHRFSKPNTKDKSALTMTRVRKLYRNFGPKLSGVNGFSGFRIWF